MIKVKNHSRIAELENEAIMYNTYNLHWVEIDECPYIVRKGISEGEKFRETNLNLLQSINDGTCVSNDNDFVNRKLIQECFYGE